MFICLCNSDNNKVYRPPAILSFIQSSEFVSVKMAKRPKKRKTPSSNIQANSLRKKEMSKAQGKNYTSKIKSKKKSSSEVALVRKVGSSTRLPIAQSGQKRSRRLAQPGHLSKINKQSLSSAGVEKKIIGPKEFHPPKIDGMALLPKFMISISALLAAVLLFFFIIVFFIANNALDKEIKIAGVNYTQSLAIFTKNYIQTVYDYQFLESKLKNADSVSQLNSIFSDIQTTQLTNFDSFLTGIRANNYQFDKKLQNSFLDVTIHKNSPVYDSFAQIQKDVALAAIYHFKLYQEQRDILRISNTSKNDVNVPKNFRNDETVSSFFSYCMKNHSNGALNRKCKNALDNFYEHYEHILFTIQNLYHDKFKKSFMKPLITQTAKLKGVYIGRVSGLKFGTDGFVSDNFKPREFNLFPYKIGNVKISDPVSGVRQFHTSFTLNNIENDDKEVQFKVIVEYDNNELEKSKSLLMISLIILALLAMIIGVGVSYFLGHAVTNPIMHLVDTVKQIAQGNYKVRTQVRSRDEFWVLGKTIDMMCNNLDSAKELALVFSKYKHDIDITEEVIIQLLPEKIPTIEHLDMHAYYNPAKEVGGDYYDFIQIDDEHLGIIVADVSGKGLPGAMVMTMSRTILRYEAVKSLSPKEVLSRSNRHITHDIKRGMFVTAFYLVLNIKDLSMVASSAGHNPMFVYRYKSGNIEKVNPNGIALGFDKGDIFEQTLKEETVQLEPGDRIILYTDGVVEAQKYNTEEQFGEDKLLNLISNNPDSDSKEITKIIENAIIEHQGGMTKELQNDDITIVTMRRT